jgi:phosphoenolpyruvate-protein phosphotransferase
MIELTPENIRLGAQVATKEEAIRAAGRVLVDAGNIAPGYVESMLGREQQANTFLGNGIAIPHGMQKDRELIHRTGISVVQLPDGVEWNQGQTARLIVGIAAKSDEHLAVLAALTDVLDDPKIARQLAQTNDPAEIIAALNRRMEAAASPTEQLANAKQIELTLAGSAGLHARPATFFVDVASEFSSEIFVRFNGKLANGKAMASLLKLGVTGGSTIQILANGDDADAALTALREAVENGLGDEEEKEAVAEEFAWEPASTGHWLGGVSASPGLAIGPIFHFQSGRLVVEDKPKDIETEKKQLKYALEEAREQLAGIHEAVKARAGRSEAAIFRAHQAFLTDIDLFSEVHELIEAGHSAAWSWQQVIDNRVAEVERVQNERLAGRAADLHDVGQRVLRLLTGAQPSEVQLPNERVILVADDLTPSDTARLDPKRIRGLCTGLGGATSHTAIIARSLDIPAVVGAGAAVLEQSNGAICILDGSRGRLYIEPNDADLKSAEAFQVDLHRRRDVEFETRYQPAITTDGHRVEVVANIGKAADAARAVEAGAEGVGLLRTEFLFLERQSAPTEDEQFAAYSAMTKALNGLPLIIRTLDIGGDKVVPYLSFPKEDNPFLGVRGIRLCLRHPELFVPQLRAIYRAGQTGPVKIMFPMVGSLEDLRAAKEVAEKVRAELGAPPVEIGIMIEVPSAALLANELAREVDFFSIGTNDLTQYVLAMDRMHPAFASQVDGLHPVVLRLIDQTVRAATAAGKWVGVCGGVAGEPRGAMIMAGLGVTELSMSLPSIAAIKAQLRNTSLVRLKAFAKKALACQSAPEVRALEMPA